MRAHVNGGSERSATRLSYGGDVQCRMPGPVLTPLPTYPVTDYVGSRACAVADRGAYRRETLRARFGDMSLPDVLIALTACDRRGVFSRPCGAGYVEPPGLLGIRISQDL